MTTLVAPMSRRKYVITARMNERDYPYIVELALPPGGFRARSGAMLTVHRERDIQIRRGQGRNDEGNSMFAIVSAIQHMPMRSVIDLAGRIPRRLQRGDHTGAWVHDRFPG